MMNRNMGKTRKIIFILLIVSSLILLIIGFMIMNKKSSGDVDSTAEEKSNQVTYNGYVYELPSTCEYRSNYMENGIKKLSIFDKNALWSATIRTVDSSILADNKEDLFKDYTVLEDILEEAKQNVDEGQLKYYGAIPIVSFHLHSEGIDYLLAYIPAYDDNLYCIRLISSKFVGNKEVYIYDYDTLEYVIDILKTGKKK